MTVLSQGVEEVGGGLVETEIMLEECVIIKE